MIEFGKLSHSDHGPSRVLIMKTAPRVNYVGPSEIEYTEIRPIRPNQSVILAGLGVTGSRVTANTKDRRYRSRTRPVQDMSFSDGMEVVAEELCKARVEEARMRGTIAAAAVLLESAALGLRNGR